MKDYVVKALMVGNLITVAENISEFEAYKIQKDYIKKNISNSLFIDCFIAKRIV